MKLVRFRHPSRGIRMGWIEDSTVYDLTSATGGEIHSLQDLIVRSDVAGVSLSEAVERAVKSGREKAETYTWDDLDRSAYPEGPYLLRPIDPPEIWAAGVTYERSREARAAESQTANLYEAVYVAQRPEIFFKDSGIRTSGPNEPVGIRDDSNWMVPEPELGLVIGSNLQVVGYTVGNDMSSRDIEGENPLYLPQAKIFAGCCAIGPAVALVDEVEDPYNLGISCRIWRGSVLAFEGETSTSKLKRRLEELVSYLGRDNIIRPGTVLLTGTCIVPPEEFTLQEGDVIEITIERIGTLRNPVRKAGTVGQYFANRVEEL